MCDLPPVATPNYYVGQSYMNTVVLAQVVETDENGPEEENDVLPYMVQHPDSPDGKMEEIILTPPLIS